MAAASLTRLLALAAALMVFLPVNASAQRDTTGAVLPDIAPREFEIRGTLEISFPSLRRQPLVGFNPPPRVPDVPAGRRPFAEPYSEASPMPDLSVLRRPEPPGGLPGADLPPAGGLIAVGGGRYYSRFARAYLNTPLSARTALLTRLSYRGSDGHLIADGDPDVHAAFDEGDGRVAVHSVTERSAVSGGLEGYFARYDLYGAALNAAGEPLPLGGAPQREAAHLAGTLRYGTVAAATVDAELGVRFSGTRYETRIRDDSLALPDVAITERRLEADGRLSVPVRSGVFWTEAQVSTGSLNDNLGGTTAIDAGAGFRFTLGRSLSMTVGGRFLAALSDTDRPREAREATNIGYVSPDARIEWRAAPGFSIYARHRPGVSANGLADVFGTNPYLVDQPLLRPTLRSVDGEGGLNVYVGPVQVHARGGYRDYPQFLFFEQSPSDQGGAATAVRYAEVAVIHVGGGLSATLTRGLFAMLDVSYRDARLTRQNDADVPYYAPFVGEATVSYAFAEGRGLVQATGRLEGARYRDRSETQRLDAFFDLDLEASYRISPHIGMLARLENIGSDRNARWDGYPISPVVMGVGLQVHW